MANFAASSDCCMCMLDDHWRSEGLLAMSSETENKMVRLSSCCTNKCAVKWCLSAMTDLWEGDPECRRGQPRSLPSTSKIQVSLTPVINTAFIST